VNPLRRGLLRCPRHGVDHGWSNFHRSGWENGSVQKRGAWGIGGSVVLAALLAGCGHGTPQAGHKPPSTTAPAAGLPASHGATTSTPTTTATVVTTVDETASLPIVSCPTKFALATPPPIVPVPASVTVNVPTALAGKLAVYTDTNDIMKLLAPTGWSCSASYGADGSGIVTIVPKGESLPASGLTSDSTDQAITAYETGGSSVQAAAAACSVFPAAAAATESDLGKGCSPRPPSEIVDPLSTTVVDFEDPAGVKGSGDPSGGQDPANGIMTYSPTTEGPGYYLETCTLAQNEHEVCTAALNYFVTLYGQG